MKKITKVLAIILCMAMMFTLCACGKTDTEKFIGTWETEVDMTDYILEGVKADLGENAGYFDFGKIYAKVTYIFNEDGTYKTEIEITDDSVAEFNAALEVGFTALMDDYFAVLMESFNITREDIDAEYLEMYGMSFDEYIEASIEDAMTQFDIQGSLANAGMGGKWKAEDGKMFFNDDIDDEEFGDGDYNVYEELTDGSFTFVEGYTDGEEDELNFFPMTFTKVK